MEISLSKKQHYWSGLVGITGFLKMKRKEINDMVLKNNEISEGLKEVNLPYEDFSNVRSFDEIMASDEVLNTIKSAPNNLGLVDRGIIKVKQFTSNSSEVVQNKGHFASKIGNQPADVFVNNSMNNLLQNGFSTGTRKIISQLKSSKLKSDISSVNVSVGHIGGLANWPSATGNFLKKSFSDVSSKLGVGAKNFLANNFNKIGGAIVRGLNAAVTLPTKLVGSLGIKTVAPFIIGFFLLFFLLGIIQNNQLISALVNIDSKNLNMNGGGGPFSHGEIITENGRIISCGVGMETDFYRKEHNLMISPDAISQSGKTIDDYNNELKEYVGDDYGNQCGVVYAAQYLAYGFNFWVPYSWGGIRDIGIHPKWGTPHDDGHGHQYEGVDCASFRGWAYDNGLGYRPAYKGEIPFGDCDRIKAVIEPGDSLQINGDSYHTSIVLEYNETQIKFAHSGSKSGVTTGIVDICTGRQIGEGSGNNFTHLQKRNYPASRGEQKPDNQITEEEQKPEGETTETGHKTNDKGEFLDLTSGLGLNYSLYLPANYDSQKNYPLLVFLHGWGERGNDLNILYNNSNTIPGILKGGNYYDAIIVSPQSPSSWGSASNYGRVMPLINEIMGKYSVDTERISLTAHSDGVWGLWKIVNNNPGFFSVVVPIGSSSDPDNYNGLTDTKVWSYWMTRDNTQETNPDGTWTTNKSALIKAINEASGVNNAKVTRIEGGHGSTRLVYIGAEPVLELMLSQINSNK